MTAVFAIPDPAFCHAFGLLLAACRPGYPRRTTTAAISSPKNNGTSTGGTSHSRKLNLWVSDM
jgi:hypothetical protein